MRRIVFLVVVLVCSAAVFGQEDVTQGSLIAANKKGVELGFCPLKTTSVKTDISGFLARVSVRQQFENSFSEPIEAIYVFPLSHNGAVDSMTMTVGERIIRGQIMKREEAKQVYDAAKAAGKTASLLDQERTNIFTQSVANIMPGESVVIEISYVETLKYEDGAYEFVFPMTIAPRYMPGGVVDAARISPPVAETRAGHDISVEVNLNAGVPVEDIRSISHTIDQVNPTPGTAKINLRGERVIPNKDFILRYDVTGSRIEDAILTHRDERGGFFTLMLQPPDKIAIADRTPKEIVFVLDTSGSMSGFPIEKAKEAMRLSLDGLHPGDTFNLITFAGNTSILFEKPVPATRANLDSAQQFLADRRGSGGTEMMKAVRAALDPSDAADHLRIVCFMTDGVIGNDDQIIAEIQRHPKARVFTFGIGNSVNRSLLDRMAREGRGEAEYVSLQDDGSKAAKRFYERVRTPMLTDLSIDWNGMPVAYIYPTRLPDLFSAKPVIAYGRYTKGTSGKIKLKGKVAGQPYERSISVNLPESEPANDVLATLWARTRIDDLVSTRLNEPNEAKRAELQKQITDLALEFRLLTQFTSFVAVEDRVVNQNGTQVTIRVPVEFPDGMDRKATLGSGVSVDVVSGSNTSSQFFSNVPTSPTAQGQYTIAPTQTRSGLRAPGRGGQGSGSGTGYGSGSANSGAMASVVVTASNVASSEVAAPENGYVIDASVITGRGKGRREMIPGGVLYGRAVTMTKPEYPATARAVRLSGPVSVQVTINEAGDVITTDVVSGPPLLSPAAVAAALTSKFDPVVIGGQTVRVTGVLVYDFRDSDRPTTITITNAKVAPLTPEQRLFFNSFQKMHFWVFELAERVRTGGPEGANEARFVRGGRALIQIELTVRSTPVIDKLRALGLESLGVQGRTGVTGHIGIDKLANVAEIADVTLISPRILP